jgi:hypothetical protein
VVAVWSQPGILTAPTDPAIGPLTRSYGGAPRGIRTPNRQIRSLVTVRTVSRIKRSGPGCRGEDLIQPGTDPVTQAAMPRNRGQIRLITPPRTPPPVTRPRSRRYRLGRRQHARDPGHRGRQVPQSSPTTPRPPQANSLRPLLSLRPRGQQPNDEPSHLGRHPTPGRGIEVWSHPRRRRRQGRPAAAGHRTTRPGASMATYPRSWRPPARPDAPLPDCAARPRRLLHEHAARGAHRSRGRGDPAGWAQPALPGGRPRPAGIGPHRPKYPHPQTSPAGPARLRQGGVRSPV